MTWVMSKTKKHIKRKMWQICVDSNSSTSDLSVDMRLYRYFVFCVSLSSQSSFDILISEHVNKSQSNRTFLEMTHNIFVTFEIFTTWTTAELFIVRVFQLMTSHFSCCIEMLRTITANIRLHIFMTKQMYLKITTAAELLLTNVTREPSTFIVWLQKMGLEMAMLSKTVWTVS